MVEPSMLRLTTLASSRVFMPDLAQQACVPAARRQALGAWTSPATAEIYTRTLRTGIVSVWRETVGELDKLDAVG